MAWQSSLCSEDSLYRSMLCTLSDLVIWHLVGFRRFYCVTKALRIRVACKSKHLLFFYLNGTLLWQVYCTQQGGFRWSFHSRLPPTRDVLLLVQGKGTGEQLMHTTS